MVSFIFYYVERYKR